MVSTNSGTVAPAPIPLRDGFASARPIRPSTASGTPSGEFDAVPTTIDLPVDRRGPADRRRSLTAIDVVAGAGAVDRWTAILAIFAHRYSGSEEIAIHTVDASGTPVLVRLQVTGDDRVEDLVSRAGQAPHEPSPAVVVDEHEQVGVRIAILAADRGVPDGVELALRCGESGVTLLADTALWHDSTIRRMAGHLANAYASAAANPAAIAGTVALIDAAERTALVVGLNNTDASWPAGSYLDLLAGHASQQPDAVAVQQGPRSLTFAELDTQTNRIAHRLRRAGARPGVRVGVFAPRGIDYVLAALGVLKTGAAAAVFDPANPDQRLVDMIDDAEPVAVLHVVGIGDRLPGGVAAIAIDPGEFAAEPETPVAVDITGDTISHLIFTSGSTGRPKAVMERHGAILNLVHWTRRAYGVRPGDRASWLSTSGFAVQLMEWMPYLGAGVSVHIPVDGQAQSPEELRDWLVAERITHTMLVAALAERAWKLNWPAETALRVMVTTAERVHSWPLLDTPFRVVMTYGSTETTNVLTCLDIGAGIDLTAQGTDREIRAVRPVPAGRPIANVRAYLLDTAGEPVPIGVVGRLHVAGAGLAAGYHRRDDLTSSKFRPNPLPEEPSAILYDTGDLARRRPDGAIEIVGRNDGQVKIRGHRVELGEVEAQVIGVPGVGEAVVVAREYGAGDIRLVAFAAPTPGAALTGVDVRDHVAGHLPQYMVPSAVVVLDALPRLANGKIDRTSLPDVDDDHRESVSTAYVAPRTDTERALVTLWQDSLRMDRIGINDSFFELGGHSLLAFALIERIRHELSADLSPVEFNRTPTIAAIAVLVDEAGPGPRETIELPGVRSDPANRFMPFPLNDSQQALWIGRGDAVELGNVGCHGYFEWESPNLDIERFRRAWRRLVDRHDSLRTVIRPSGVQQVLATPPDYPISVCDLREASPDEVQRQLGALRDELSHQVIADGKWPLFDVRLTQLAAQAPGENRVRLHLSLDMLIADAWSYFQVLIPDLVHLYEHPDGDVKPLELTFRDYVMSLERELENSDLYARAKKYWLDRVAELPPAPQLPARPAWQPALPTRFIRCDHRLDPASWSRFKTNATRYGATPSCVLAAVFAEVLRRWSGQERFTINFPLFNRLPLHPEINQIIGDTTTTLLLAVEKSDGSFADRVQSLQRQLWADLEHRHFSGVRVIRELSRLRGGVVDASMPIVMTSLLGHPPRAYATSIGDAIYTISQTPQVSVDFQVFEIAGELQFNWDFLPSLFPDDLVPEMFEAYCDVLHRLADEPASWQLDGFDLLPAALRAQRDAINDTACPVRDVLLHDLLAEQAGQRPDAPAVIGPERTLTYGELWQAANGLAHQLRAAGVGPGQLVGVVMRKGWEQYVAVYASLLAGAAYLPIDPNVPAARLRLLLQRGLVNVAVTQPDLDEVLDWPSDVHTIRVDDQLVDTASEPFGSSATAPTDLAYVLFTSGSTGEPKGVMVSHRSVVNHIDDVNRRFGLGAHDRVMATSALHFDMSVHDVFGIIAAGGAAVLPAPEAAPNPEAWIDAATKGHVTFWSGVPALIELVVARAEDRSTPGLGSLRTVLMAGDWIPLNLPDRIRAIAPQVDVISSGGPTETINWSIVYPVGAVDERWTSIPYGMPMSNHRYVILDDRRNECPLWVPGEMYDISDVGLAAGYWRDPERTEAAFITLATGERAYATGDRGRYLPSGDIEILGRVDFQVKVRGHRIELGEIETALRHYPGIRDAVVVAVGEHAHRQLVAHVAGDGEPVSSDTLRDHIAALLPAPFVPSHVVWHEKLPLSTSAKIDRKALSGWTLHESARTPAPVVRTAPMDDLERAIAGVWQDILDVDAVGPTDRFFDLGGNSMTATLVAGQLTDLLDVEIPVRALFDLATVAEVATALRADAELGGLVLAAIDRLVGAVA